MDLSFGPGYDAFRAEVRAFLADWEPGGDETAFRRRGIERGYVYRHIPTEYGGSGQPHDVLRDAILGEEYAASSAPGEILGGGPQMLSPTLLDLGTEEQKRRFIPPTLLGEMIWCQGYSEPGAGSDLASLVSRAELDGDEWVINGHKIWTSHAHRADYMFGLFRTEPDAARHAGISYLLVDMHAPGIEIRPIRELIGGAFFNEVFLHDVRIPASSMVGKRGEGWKVSRVTLRHERNSLGDISSLQRIFDGTVDLARRAGRLVDPEVRQRLGEIRGFLWSHAYTVRRQLSANAAGRAAEVALPNVMMKLYATLLRERLCRLALDLLGADALIAPGPDEYRIDWPETSTAWTQAYMRTLAYAIGGGTSNIQRNVIGERGLGLPRDLRNRGDVPLP